MMPVEFFSKICRRPQAKLRGKGSLPGKPRSEWFVAMLLALTSLSGCTGAGTGFMDPAGPVAGTERIMFFEIAAVTLIVVVPVFLLVPWILWRYRRKAGGRDYAPEWESSTKLEWIIWGVPVLIVAALAVFVWIRTHQLDPYRELEGPGDPIEIQVVALDWKWLFIYPEEGIASVNEMAIPVGRPVNLKLTSGTVMQSFHVPKLAGQIYTMAGMTTELSLRADRAGTYRGRNTQYNGDGFAKQQFDVVALQADRFDAWVAQAQASGRTLDESGFLALAEPSTAAAPAYYGRLAPDMFGKIRDLSTRADGSIGASPRHRNAEAAQ